MDLGPKAENDRQLHTFQGWILATIVDLGAKVDHLPRVETVSIVDLGPKTENDRLLHTVESLNH